MKERETGLDIVKAFATFFVVWVHFYLSIGYYQTPICSYKMYTMTFFRWAVLIGVPLFLMATGYFKSNKQVTKNHYMSLVPILITYVILCTFRMAVENIMYGKIHTISSGIKSLLSYQSAWYVGMYVALMLLCPFLNKLWKACSKKEHIILVLSLVAITMAYSVFSYVFPSYFQFVYPITYYYFGVYIKEYRPTVNKVLLVALFVLSNGVNLVITLYNTKGGIFNPGLIGMVDNGQNALTVAIAAVSFFLLFYDVKIKGIVASLFKSVSNCSLEIYLIQAACNAVIYTYARRRIVGAENYFWIFFLTVPLSFGLSWIMAAVYKLIFGKIAGIIKK